jgi:amidase
LTKCSKHTITSCCPADVFPFDADIHWPQQIDRKKMDTYRRWMEDSLFATLIGRPANSARIRGGATEAGGE